MEEDSPYFHPDTDVKRCVQAQAVPRVAVELARGLSLGDKHASKLDGYTRDAGRSMVRWYHLIITAYGFWLPNDPRGSWSDFVGSWELRKFGPATKTTEKRSLAHDAHDVSRRLAAKNALKYPPVRFDAVQRRLIGDGFARAIAESHYAVHACCVGHDHSHLVVARHARTVEQMATHLKSRATMALTRGGVHPLRSFGEPAPTPWSHGNWSVFVNDCDQLAAAVRYVDRHPMKEGLAVQRWDFVRAPD